MTPSVDVAPTPAPPLPLPLPLPSSPPPPPSMLLPLEPLTLTPAPLQTMTDSNAAGMEDDDDGFDSLLPEDLDFDLGDDAATSALALDADRAMSVDIAELAWMSVLGDNIPTAEDETATTRGPWTDDVRRVQAQKERRRLSNRQAAARSRERFRAEVLDMERKVHSLQVRTQLLETRLREQTYLADVPMWMIMTLPPHKWRPRGPGYPHPADAATRFAPGFSADAPLR